MNNDGKDTTKEGAFQVETPSQIQYGDLQGMHPAYRLNGRNYLKWSQVVLVYLKAEGKLSHLT